MTVPQNPAVNSAPAAPAIAPTLDDRIAEHAKGFLEDLDANPDPDQMAALPSEQEQQTPEVDAETEAPEQEAETPALPEVPMVEVDIGDQWHRHCRFDLGKDRSRRLIRHGDANDLATGFFQLTDLSECGCHIARIGRTHGLDRNRRIAADLHRSCLNLPRFFPCDMHEFPGMFAL
jgi:hypothetical protein